MSRTCKLAASRGVQQITARDPEPSSQEASEAFILGCKIAASANAGPEITATSWQLWVSRWPFLRYAIAGTSVAIALGLALLSQRYNFHNVEVQYGACVGPVRRVG